jgi:6-phosphogluconate dehydrogenase
LNLSQEGWIMELGMVGLGKMGGNMTARLQTKGHQVVVYDLNSDAVKAAEETGAEGVSSLEELTGKMGQPRAVWVMVPAGEPTEQTIHELSSVLEPDDTVIDGGNSFYKDTLRRAKELEKKGLHYIDVGVSGGVWGLTEGYGLMVGGPEEIVQRLRPIFETLAPAPDRGWARVGTSGAGHYVKMVHNGIEYGLMQAYAEGFALLRAKEEFNLDLSQIAEAWRYGTVIRSWLLDLTAKALKTDQELVDIAPWVSDSGEGRWTVQESIDLAVPAPVITESLFARFRSRRSENYADRLLAALRREFGGHAVKRDT